MIYFILFCCFIFIFGLFNLHLFFYFMEVNVNFKNLNRLLKVYGNEKAFEDL